jgi:hypothetical protein
MMAGRLPLEPRLARAWPWLPLAFAALWAFLLVASIRSLVYGIYLDADLASALFIGEVYDEAPDGAEVILGNYPWYSTLWFEHLTRGLPAHRQLWQVAPWVGSLIGIGALAWATARASDRWAGMVVAVVLACSGSGLLIFQFAGNARAPTVLSVCLFGAFLVLCAVRGGIVGRPVAHGVLSAVVAAIGAAGFASDKLFAVAGIAPLVGAGLASLWLLDARAGRRLAATATLVGGVSAVAGAVLLERMRDSGVRALPLEIAFAPFEELFSNLRLLGQAQLYLFNGNFAGRPIEFSAVLALACAVVIVAAWAAAIGFARRWTRQAALDRPVPRPANGHGAARAVHISFWLLATALPALAFVFSTVPVDTLSARYVVTVGYGVVTLVAVRAAGGGAVARTLVVAGACVVVTGSIASLVRRDIQDNNSNFPTARESKPLLDFARAQGVKYGYAGYWDAAPLSWQMKAEVQIYPVSTCGSGLCAFWLHRISSWYTPRPGARTMLIVDPTQLRSAAPGGPPPEFGRPSRTAGFGQLRVYVYPYDIASRFGP